MGVYLCAAHAVCISILLHRCSAPQRKSQQRRTISLLFSRTNILVIFSLLHARVHFSEANGGSGSSGHPVTMLHLLRLCLSVNFPACFSILYKGILYHFRAHLFNVLLTRRGIVRDVMISKATCKTLLLPLCALKAGKKGASACSFKQGSLFQLGKRKPGRVVHWCSDKEVYHSEVTLRFCAC